MKPYGRRLRDELEYNGMGCPSRHRRIRGRKAKRRLLHQVDRRAGKAEAVAQLNQQETER